MSEWTRDLESAALHYLTGGTIDPAGARQIIDGLIAKGRAEVTDALELGDLADRVSASCPTPGHPTWLRARSDARGCPWCRNEELEQQATAATGDLTVYRAQHDLIVMGLYTTAAEARAHCVAEERCFWPTGTSLVFDWIEDEEDGVAELVTVAEDGETEAITGYVVEALTVAAAYDPDGDE